MSQNERSVRRGWRRLLVSLAALLACALCFTTQCLARCGERHSRTVGEYALSAGVAGTAPSGGSQQGTALFGPGLGMFVTPRLELEGDLLITPQASIGGTGLLEVLPFRDAFKTGCLIPYFAAGGAGDSDLLYAGPSAGGGFKYYNRQSALGLDVRGIGVFPQAIPNSGTVYKGTVFMITLRLLFQP